MRTMSMVHNDPLGATTAAASGETSQGRGLPKDCLQTLHLLQEMALLRVRGLKGEVEDEMRYILILR